MVEGLAAPAAADPRAAAAGRRRATAIPASTSSSASRPAASCWPPPSRWTPASASSRCARPASCRASGSSADYELEYGTATLELHADSIRPGPAGARRRRRPGDRRHAGRRRRPGRAARRGRRRPSSVVVELAGARWPPAARAARRARPLDHLTGGLGPARGPRTGRPTSMGAVVPPPACRSRRGPRRRHQRGWRAA